jgi:hypothetical protein
MPLLKLRPKRRDEHGELINKTLEIDVDVKAENDDEWYGFMEAEKNIPNHKPIEMTWTKNIWEVVPDGADLKAKTESPNGSTVHTAK